MALPEMVGVRVMVPVTLLLRFREVTVTTPAALVATEATNLEVAEADSQPQALAAGSEAVGLDCTTSVMVVRQAEAASITSDTWARTV